MPGREHIVWVPNRGGHIHSSELLYILIAKYHIYCQRIHNENGINFFQYLIELKNKLRIEKYICTIEKFDKFQFLYEQL